MSAIIEHLDKAELTKLRKLESVVAEGISNFVLVGEALKEIRDEKLYRESHKTFEKYVDQKWGIVRQRAYQLIDAAEAKSNLSKIFDKNKIASSIKTESQLRELKDVPSDKLPEVISTAVERAGDKPMTAKILKEARDEVLVTEPKTVPKKVAKGAGVPKVADGRTEYKHVASTNKQYAQMAILQMERIDFSEAGWSEAIDMMQVWIDSKRGAA